MESHRVRGSDVETAVNLDRTASVKKNGDVPVTGRQIRQIVVAFCVLFWIAACALIYWFW